MAFGRFSSVVHVPFPLWGSRQEGDYVSVVGVRTFPSVYISAGSYLGFGGVVFPRHFGHAFPRGISPRFPFMQLQVVPISVWRGRASGRRDFGQTDGFCRFDFIAPRQSI